MTNVNHSLPKGKSDEHYTPKHIFDKIGLTFDLDVCSPEGGSNVPCSSYYTKADDGLTSEWFGNIWMNPPYSAPSLWVERFCSHANGIALLPMTRGKWFDKIWRYSDAICLLPYNQKFELPDGLPSKPIVFRTALFAMGHVNRSALIDCGLGFVR